MTQLRPKLLAGAIGRGAMPAGPAFAQSDPARDKLIADARKEGDLVYCTFGVDAINQAVVDAFTAKYGIKVDWLRLASGPLASRFAKEQKAGHGPADGLRRADGSVFVENPNGCRSWPRIWCPNWPNTRNRPSCRTTARS